MDDLADIAADAEGETAERFAFDSAGTLEQVANIVEALPDVPQAAPASPRTDVSAFEPVAKIREIARRNVARNSLADRVAFVPCAVGDCNGEAQLFSLPDNHGMVETSASLNPAFEAAHHRALTVGARRLDRSEFFCAHRWKRVSLIKIDVEGQEAAALDGARWLIMLHRPVIFIVVLRKTWLDWLHRFIADRRYVPVGLGAGRTATPGERIIFDLAWGNHVLVPHGRLHAFSRYGTLA